MNQSICGRTLPGSVLRGDGGVGMSRIVAAALSLALALTIFLASNAAAAEWKQQTAPDPVPGTSAKFNDVFCFNASPCVAVGQVEAPEGKFSAFIERWNGTTWATQAVGGTISHLEGVSCVTANECTAVGWNLTKPPIKQTAGVERWNGTSWTYQAVPLPEGTLQSVLHDVSCDSNGQCTAVGYYINASGQRLPLVERWAGGSWTLQTAAIPAEMLSPEFNDVWCGHWVVGGVSKDLCTAVGVGTKGGLSAALANYWDGKTWTVKTVPAPAESKGTRLDSVSCPNSLQMQECSAVGSSVLPSEYWTGFRVKWETSAWKAASGPTPMRLQLTGVSCPAASSCLTVGNESVELTEVLHAEAFSGSSWSAITAPPGSGRTLSSVSCPSTATVCTAVGGYWEGFRHPLVMRYS